MSDGTVDPRRVDTWMSPASARVTPDTPLDDAFAKMRQLDVRHLLVTEDDRLVGVVTDRDLRRPDRKGELWTLQELYMVGDGLQVHDVMTSEVLITVSSEATIADAARMLVTNRINCLPVMRKGQVAGILTTTDLLAALVHELEPELDDAEELPVKTPAESAAAAGASGEVIQGGDFYDDDFEGKAPDEGDDLIEDLADDSDGNDDRQ